MTNAQAPSAPMIKYTTEIPETIRGRGRTSGENVYQAFMMQMPAPVKGKGKDAPTQFAWFFVPAEIPTTITDAGERDKAGKDGTRKLINRFTSMARRIRKDNADTHDYTFRKARDPDVADGKGEWGIVVYRIVPGTKTNVIGKKATA